MNSNLTHVYSVSTIQSNTKNLLNYGATTYTPEQNNLYKRLLIGRNAFTDEEWYAMNDTKKRRIIKQYKKAQALFNTMKQEALLKTNVVIIESNNAISIGLLKILNLISKEVTPDPEFVCKMPFKDLGITKDMRVERLMQEGLLPANFNSL